MFEMQLQLQDKCFFSSQLSYWFEPYFLDQASID